MKSSAGPDASPLPGPVRTCIGCRQRAAKRELLRVTAGSDPTTGQPVVWPDPGGAAPGRGAHLHPTSGCYDLAVRRRAFPRALRLAQGSGGQGLSTAPVSEYVAALTIDPTASIN
ncbi:YlxR family protein [Nocardioides sp. zg-ZUI104]|uniref:YlxR family protein n=1 Tax=Nocardioides faecalis TaxID=2803858 RepID=UPI001BCAC814|nr:YlxR family protein [Nocardioides faecalis]MBS4752375.1 YlxR family protein [Nocardioides faecalis]